MEVFREAQVNPFWMHEVKPGNQVILTVYDATSYEATTDVINLEASQEVS